MRHGQLGLSRAWRQGRARMSRLVLGASNRFLSRKGVCGAPLVQCGGPGGAHAEQVKALPTLLCPGPRPLRSVHAAACPCLSKTAGLGFVYASTY